MAKKYIDADLLRKEIEKRKNICNGVYERDSDTYYQGKAVAYQETLSLIDSLRQEQPSEDLEEEIQRYLREECSSDDEPTIGEIARHFAEWQKAKMLKEAVEGYVNYYEDGGGKLMAEAQVGCPYHIGDRVKIVIIKEEKK